MKLTGGLPFWLIRDGLPYQYPKLDMHTETSVAIIGGGISGALTAYALTEAGIPCIVVDARAIGSGSSCASTSLLQYELDIPLHLLSKKIGWHTASRAYQLCGESIDRLINIMDRIGYTEYARRESLFFSTHRKELDFMKEELNARKNAGFSVSLLSKDELKKTYGLAASSGILSAQGATVNAYSLTQALLQYSIKKGLRVYDHTEIKKIRHKRNYSELISTDGFKIKTGKVVNATGYEVVNFVEKNIVDFYCTYAAISAPDIQAENIWNNRALLWNSDDPYLYLRCTPGNRIIIGGHDVRFSNKVTREILLDKKISLLEKDFTRIFPGHQYKAEYAWCGTFGKTKDSLPFIGAYKNAYYALGFGGNGITFSVIAADMLCEIFQGKNHPDAALFSFDRSSV